MIERVLVAVDDSPASLAAARLAIELAGRLHARLLVVHVAADHELERALGAVSSRPVAGRRDRSGVALLDRIAGLAAADGIAAETELRGGDIGSAVLAVAREWAADLVVIGTSTGPVSGEAYIGARARHILEFAEQAVLVVPVR